MKKKVVLATGNPGKVKEMQSQLEDFGYEVIAQSTYNFEEAVEDGLSFVENALIKARHACKYTGLPAIADDSGLEVDALQGAPGIYSSRFADGPSEHHRGDQANNTKLLNKLKGIEKRTARFQCVIVYMEHELDPTPIICEGTWEGSIANIEKGDFGFGYDPLFYVTDQQCHAAELDSKIKNKISHRAQAIDKLGQRLQSNNARTSH